MFNVVSKTQLLLLLPNLNEMSMPLLTSRLCPVSEMFDGRLQVIQAFNIFNDLLLPVCYFTIIVL